MSGCGRSFSDARLGRGKLAGAEADESRAVWMVRAGRKSAGEVRILRLSATSRHKIEEKKGRFCLPLVLGVGGEPGLRLELHAPQDAIKCRIQAVKIDRRRYEYEVDHRPIGFGDRNDTVPLALGLTICITKR